MNQQPALSSVTQATRQQLRRTFRAKRQALTPLQQTQASKGLLNTLITHSVLDSVQHLALYLPNDGELDPTRLIHYAWQNGINTYLPVLHPFHKKSLLFVAYTADTLMHANKFGIPEPHIECLNICPAQQLDLILTPLVAFDAAGNRMGMGGGFYDRTLAPIYAQNPQFQDNHPRLIGVAHDCQEMDSVPTESWDIPLQAILTPTRAIEGSQH